jgi:hypothetical protein
MVYLVIRFGHDGNAIKMDIQHGQPQKVEFSQFAMIPGGKSEYIIIPYRYVPGVYNLTFDFQDKEIGHSIFDKSVYVYIECDGVVYCDQRLSSIFDSENPVITLDLAYIVDHEKVVSTREIVHLTFSNGKTVKMIGEHVFFDATLNKYVAITSENADSLVGHKFIALDESGAAVETVELISVNREVKETEVYEVVSYKHLTCFTEGILSTSAFLDPLLNVFDIDPETLTYDMESVQRDIETYGLYTYEDFEGLISEEAFELYNAKYLKIAVGKGYITWDDILELIDIYFDAGVTPIAE